MVPLLAQVGFGAIAFLLPLGISGIFQGYGFRVALDVLGVVLVANALGFLMHAGRSNWGKPSPREESLEEEQGLIP